MTHRGLADFDPWGAESRQRGSRSVWPWGLAQVSETLEVIALAILMFLAFRAVGHTYIVSGASMEPNFHDADMLMVNRLAYRSFDLSWLPGLGVEEWSPFGEPERGDVVVFDFPNDPSRDFIKRVIGVPGDVVEVRRDVGVFVNGMPLEEPYLTDEAFYDFGPIEVPPGQVFVLGDNRNNSYDSHSWGLLEQDLIIGRADVRYWPLHDFGLVGHHSFPDPGITVERGGSQAEAAESP